MRFGPVSRLRESVLENLKATGGLAMKKLLLSASALCALAALTAGSAAAADMRMPVYRAAAPLVCPTCNWTGFYVGFNAGESKDWSTTTDTWTWFFNAPPGSFISVGAGDFIPGSGTFTTAF